MEASLTSFTKMRVVPFHWRWGKLIVPNVCFMLLERVYICYKVKFLQSAGRKIFAHKRTSMQPNLSEFFQTNNIFPKAQVAANDNGHNWQHHCLTKFFKLFHIVWFIFFWMSALKALKWKGTERILLGVTWTCSRPCSRCNFAEYNCLLPINLQALCRASFQRDVQTNQCNNSGETQSI